MVALFQGLWNRQGMSDELMISQPIIVEASGGRPGVNQLPDPTLPTLLMTNLCIFTIMADRTILQPV